MNHYIYIIIKPKPFYFTLSTAWWCSFFSASVTSHIFLSVADRFSILSSTYLEEEEGEGKGEENMH